LQRDEKKNQIPEHQLKGKEALGEGEGTLPRRKRDRSKLEELWL